MSDHVKQIIIDYHQRLWDEKSLEAIDAYCHPEAEFRSPLRFVKGLNAFREIISTWLTTFPDIRVNFEPLLAENDTVVSRWTAQATCAAPFMEINGTGKKVCYSGVSFFKVENDKIIDYYSLVDLDALKSQLKDSA